MKLLKALLFLSILTLTGCMKNDIDNCPYNVMLSFRYYGDESFDQFSKMIDGVTLYVFSNDGSLVTTENISRQSLLNNPGINLKLQPGNYHFTCWGNAFNETKFTGEDHLSTILLQHPNLISGMPIPTNDQLYFGSLDLELPKDDILAEEVVFSSAHIHLEIYTKGTGTSTQLPTIEIQNLDPQYDCIMNPTSCSKVTYCPRVSYDSEKNATAAKLQVLRFSDDNPIKIEIKDPLNGENSIASVNLKDFMAANNIHVNGIHEATVKILVEFNDLGINIIIPKWESEDIGPVGPGYN